MPYRAFISYSHAADGKLAPALQSALHRFAKPWYRLRALDVFRDETSLSITPALWPAIEKALSDSEYFILMASPEAAASHWVRQEVDYWLQHRSADKILIVLTEGEIVWDNAAGDFDWGRTTAIPVTLKQTFAHEPLYLDLRWAKQEEDLSLHQPKYHDAVAELAATLHGRPKDEITGEDVRQHRRTKRIQWSAVIALLTLTVASVVGFFIAFYQYRVADKQGKISLSRQLAMQANKLPNSQLDLAHLLAAESVQVNPTLEARDSLFTMLRKNPHFSGFLHCLNYNTLRVEDRLTRENVDGLAFSPDGKTLVSASGKDSIIFWDIERRKKIDRSVKGLEGSKNCVAFSLDGKKLAWGYGGNIPLFGGERKDSSIILWDLEKGEKIGKTLTDPGQVDSLAFSPDGKKLASAHGSGGKFVIGAKDDSYIILWDLEKGEKIGRPLPKIEYGVLSLAFSPDGRKLASGIEDQTLILWDLEKGEKIGKPLSKHTFVSSLAFSPDGKKLAAGKLDGTICLWDLEKVGPDNIGVGLTDDRTFIVDQDKNKEIGQILSHSGLVKSLAFTPDGKKLASGGDNQTIILWDLEKEDRVRRPLKGQIGAVTSLAFSPDGKKLASISGNNAIRWDPETGEQIGQPLTNIGSAIFSPDGRKLALMGNEGIILWDMETGEQIGQPLSVSANIDKLNTMAFSPDGKKLALMAEKSPHRTIFLWDLEKGQKMVQSNEDSKFRTDLQWHLSFIHKVAFSPDLRTLAGEEGRDIVLWDLEKGVEICRIRHTLYSLESLAFSPDGRILASGGLDKRIILWDVKRAKKIVQLGTGDMDKVKTLAFSPDGKKLAASGVLNGVHTIIVWDLVKGEQIGQPFTGHDGEVHCLAFSPNSRILASGGSRIWASEGDDLILWDVDVQSWVKRACRKANRNLTLEEWANYMGDRPYRKTCPDLPVPEE